MLRRHPLLWVILGTFGFGYALYDLGMRHVVSGYLPDDPDLKLKWTLESPVWTMDRPGLRVAVQEALLPALDSTAGLFNNLVSTFPLAALAALLLLTNWRGHQGVLVRALRKRFAGWGWAIYSCIVICAVAAMTKPLLPWLLASVGGSWAQWSTVIAWLAFLFEYVFGVCIQVYLILLAFCWVRGISFDHSRLLDFAIRRFSLVFRFAAVVLLLSSLLIDLPLILGSFELLPQWPFFDGEQPGLLIEQWTQRARAVIAAFLLLFASVQITLTFHSESLRKAFGAHFEFLSRHWWPMSWFIITAALHFYLLQLLNTVLSLGFGEGKVLWIAWRLTFPWLTGIAGAWLLGSWVSLYKRCDSSRVRGENWIQF